MFNSCSNISQTCALLICSFFLTVLCKVPAHSQVYQNGAPVHNVLESTYPISVKPSALILDPVRLSVLSTQVQTDITNFITYNRISDSLELSEVYTTLGEIATVQEDYEGALEDFQKAKSYKQKPIEKMTDCLVPIAIAETYQNPGSDFTTTLGSNLSKLIAALPYPVVQGVLKEDAGSFETQSANLEQGQLSEQVDPTVVSGHINLQFAQQVIAAGYIVQVLLPYKTTIYQAFESAINANSSPPEADIWTKREVSLANTPQLSQVICGIWDSGADTSLFTNSLYDNPTAGADGYTGDDHGVAWDEKSNVTTGLLYPLDLTTDQLAASEQFLTGFSDATANIDSPSATALRLKVASLKTTDVTPFLEQVNLFDNYCHGTAVTGIAVKDNPAARAEFCRITYDYRLFPDAPTVVQSQKTAAATESQVEFFKSHGARVVNISWVGGLGGIEMSLMAHHTPGTLQDVAILAKKIFDIQNDALYNAMKGAPDILFVTAAGNSDSDVDSGYEFPCDYKLKNMINVGAVDQAGALTSFTSTSNVDVYADGYQVPCLIPGGNVVNMSGTSMAAPAVTNLACKMLAIDPALTPSDLKRIIIDNCDTNNENGIAVKVINPLRTIDAVQIRLPASPKPA